MEDRENCAGTFDRGYDKLISQEDMRADEDPLESTHEEQQGMINGKFNQNVFMYICFSLILVSDYNIVLESSIETFYCANSHCGSALWNTF